MRRRIFYHGANKKYRYFEGWYLKHESSQCYLSVIPGIYMDRIGRKGAFIQLITQDDSYFIQYPYSEFHASKDFFAIKVGKNYFTKYGMVLNIDSDGVKAKGAVAYHEFHTVRPNLMGPFSFIPAFPCKHDVISLKHSLVGSIQVNGSEYDFTDGLGYIETDWGRSFPDGYAWTQCHINKRNNCSIFLAIAEMSIMNKDLYGCLGFFSYRSRRYKIATYLGAKVLMVRPDKWMVRQGKFRILVEPKREAISNLKAPEEGMMGRNVKENVCSPIRYRVWFDNHLILDQICKNGSYEYL
ncbi:hypothetical protein lbkm_1040 [Lachnospiraceae bacterium KM106-2]|nr:hypothetical protein lbkm_1040 [Lachnospiraceae bacterium KM106-2]